MKLSDNQAADFHRLRAYYPYRRFFLVTDPRDPQPEATVWAMRDRRAVNRVLREGGTVLELSV